MSAYNVVFTLAALGSRCCVALWSKVWVLGDGFWVVLGPLSWVALGLRYDFAQEFKVWSSLALWFRVVVPQVAIPIEAFSSFTSILVLNLRYQKAQS